MRPNAEWEIVQACNMTTETRCELGNILYKPLMKIKIGLFEGNYNFSWSAVKRIRLLDSKYSQDYYYQKKSVILQLILHSFKHKEHPI